MIKPFDPHHRQDIEDVARQEHEKGTFRRGELPERFMARKLFRWSDKRYDQEYQGRLKRNQRQWKGKQLEERKIETITKEEKTEEENLKVRECTEEDNDEMGNIVDLYYKLQENFLEMRKLKRGVVL